MRIEQLVYWKIEESFLIEFANGSQTTISYGRAAEVYESYPPVWKLFTEALNKPGEWIKGKGAKAK